MPLPRLLPVKDLRNHGDSPHDERHDYIAMAEDVEAFIAEERLEQPTLIGHSMLVALRAKPVLFSDILILLGARRSPWL